MIRTPERMTAKQYREQQLEIASKKPAKGKKFNNDITFVGDMRFDSKKEANRYMELLILVRCKKIKDLQCQVPFELAERVLLLGESRVKRAMKYICDFYYFDIEKQEMIIEDVKSPATRKRESYRNKKHLMKTKLGLDIVEI